MISTPFPSYRLAESALRALQVDEELSPLVRRTFSLVAPGKSLSKSNTATAAPVTKEPPCVPCVASDKIVLRTEYRAKTNRMLRVAVNGFMESLGVVLGVMERLDVDVLANKA